MRCEVGGVSNAAAAAPPPSSEQVQVGLSWTEEPGFQSPGIGGRKWLQQLIPRFRGPGSSERPKPTLFASLVAPSAVADPGSWR